MEKRDTRSLSADAQEALRVRAVNAVLAGRKQVEVAEFFGISRQALSEWLKTYALHGQKGLQTKPKGRHPGGRILNSQQASAICQGIKEHCPDHFNLPYYLWTRKAVEQFIKQQFCVTISSWTMRRYLDFWGFSFSKPKIHVAGSNSDIVGHWLKNAYPDIRKHAKFEKAVIYWCNNLEICLGRNIASYCQKTEQYPVHQIVKGETPSHVIYAIANFGQCNFMVYNRKIHPNDFLLFIERLKKQVNRKIFLIINKIEFIDDRLFDQGRGNKYDKIKLFFLPEQKETKLF